MKNSTRWGLAILALLALGTGVTRAIMARKADQADITQSTHSASQGALELRASDWISADRAELLRTIDISGSLKAVNSVVIKARVGGEVQRLTVREGDAVRQGQLIAIIDPQEHQSRLEQARQQAASAKAQWQITQRALDNNQALVAQGFISKNALDTSVSSAAAARATAQAADAAVDLARKAVNDTQVHSPINGHVSRQHAQLGERVQPDSRLVEVVDLSRMEIEAALKPEDVALIRIGTPGMLAIDGLAERLPATVARINPSAAPGTRAVMVYLAVSAHPVLRQGLFAQGQLELSRLSAVVLPRSTVRQGPVGTYVQTVSEGRVAHRKVVLGPQGRTAREPLVAAVAVVEGLSPGERVLKESVGLLKDGAFVRLVEQVEQVEQVKQVDQADAAASAKPAMLGTAR